MSIVFKKEIRWKIASSKLFSLLTIKGQDGIGSMEIWFRMVSRQNLVPSKNSMPRTQHEWYESGSQVISRSDKFEGVRFVASQIAPPAVSEFPLVSAMVNQNA
jgi:hypothetical protein